MKRGTVIVIHVFIFTSIWSLMMTSSKNLNWIVVNWIRRSWVPMKRCTRLCRCTRQAQCFICIALHLHNCNGSAITNTLFLKRKNLGKCIVHSYCVWRNKNVSQTICSSPLEIVLCWRNDNRGSFPVYSNYALLHVTLKLSNELMKVKNLEVFYTVISLEIS